MTESVPLEKKPTGTCPVCEQLVPLDGEGRIGSHSKVSWGQYDGPCRGAGKSPAKETTSTRT